MAKETTKAPTGLKIVRSGGSFTLTWKIGDANYGRGQLFSYMIDDTGADKWSASVKLGAKVTSRVLSVNYRSFYPYTKQYLYRIGMSVKGQRSVYTLNGKSHNPAPSAWTQKWFDVLVPNVPTTTTTPHEELTNVCTFSWSTAVSSTDGRIFTDTQYQTMLVKNSNETDGSKLSWGNATTNTGSATGSVTYTEDTAILYKNGDSYVRWFRIRSRGPRGVSAWKYAYRVYAIPRQAQVLSTKATETPAGGFQCEVNWKVGSSRQYPITKTSVQYTLTQPAAGLSCPSGASWNDADLSRDTADDDSAVFGIDDQLSVDQCLFIRVNTMYAFKTTYGKPQLSHVGYLKDPSGLSVTTDDTSYRAQITATNNSEVEDSVLVVRYIDSDGVSINVGIIPHGENTVTVQCPDWSTQEAIAFEVQAMVGSYEKQERDDGVDAYSINPIMVSQKILSDGGAVPVAPQNVTVNRGPIAGTVVVTWDWPWSNANSAEISWADHEDAWESTEEPETYTISNLHASKWNISGLETGKTWYVRVRLLYVRGDNITYGPWSNIQQGVIDLSSAPNRPVLELSDAIIPTDGTVTASWVYTTTDRTAQAYAEVAVVQQETVEIPVSEATEDDTVVYDDSEEEATAIQTTQTVVSIVGHTLTAQHVTIDAIQAGWEQGQTYDLICRVMSESGKFSEWSNVASIIVAEPLECEITQTSLIQTSETNTYIDPETEEEVTETRQYWALDRLPLTVTVTGAGAGGITGVVVERAADYSLDRPDENIFTGYEGETIVLRTQLGEAQMSIGLEDLQGSLDDGAQYRLTALVQDGLGQTARAEQEFEVHWAQQAVIPSAEIEIDEQQLITKITPILPAGAVETDRADIYRLSADRPKLVVKDAAFGQTYVDPYPALGELGGHRVVLKTINGDYITEDNELAMIDSFELEADNHMNPDQLNIIDFEGRQIQFYYHSDYSSNWSKDFQETHYLGGSVQGDWNASVSRTGSLNTKAITVLDQDMLQAVRRLAEYSGVCHVRTADGSSYAADVQVAEDRVHTDQEMLVSYSFTITRVDDQALDGMTLGEWQEGQN